MTDDNKFLAIVLADDVDAFVKTFDSLSEEEQASFVDLYLRIGYKAMEMIKDAPAELRKQAMMEGLLSMPLQFRQDMAEVLQNEEFFD